MNPSAVEIEHLSRSFGSFTAVDKITLNVSVGETFGFLGANGAGKTTTIRMLCGLLLPTEGKGKVAGFDVYRQSEQIKRTIGYMSQKFSLYSDLTGRENLNFYGAAYGLSRSRTKVGIAELSDRLELHEFLDRPSYTLPTGWRQRLALGAALLHKPKILFLDEPTSGVDPIFRRRFWALLYDLAEEGVTIFVTTHYMDEAEYCDRISIMHQGRIVEMGKPFEIVRNHHQTNLENTFISLISQQDDNNA
ncbi:MAG: ATP-binding cassette domain-containing protein [candidate division Zixibacteria bacterium]|nr:ATP-binding cassette domain-containing protein [candidate division Zixibacteria bacterium]